MKYKNNLNGIIPINKPSGLTSRDVVNKVEHLLNTKAGHTGTLDPIAEGVLVVCLGKATKLTEILTSTVKEYIAEVTLGIETDSLDSEGVTLKEEFKKITEDELNQVLTDFKGKTYMQEVPKYSAVKVNGKKLYEYARAGISVSLPKREVTIYDIKLLDFNEKKFSFYVKVSKGTYIRSLIRDIAYKLGTIGIMSKLIRTSQGKFNLQDTYTLEDIENNQYEIIKIKDVLDFKVVKVDDELKEKIINGVKMETKEITIFTDKEDNELAIYKNGKVFKMLYTKE